MTNDEPKSPTTDLDVPNGILARLILRLHLARTQNQAVVHSTLLFIGLAFVPLMVLSLATGIELNGSITMPLRSDHVTMSRYLLAAPILMLSELLTRKWLTKATARFRDIVEESDVDRYNQMSSSCFRLRDSIYIDFIILAIAFTSSICGTSIVLAIEPSSWQARMHEGSTALSIPGYWNTFLSQPLFRFVVLSWFVDYLVWTYFLFRVSRLPLRIIASHADGVGGLSFVSATQSQFAVTAFALSCAICSVVAQTVQHSHVKLQSFTHLGIVFLAVILILFVGPLLVFTPRLAQTRLHGIYMYGALCHELSRTFASKWIPVREKKSESEPILGSGDPSTLADMNSNFQTVQKMKPVLFDRQFVTGFVVATCLPALPLVASVIPLKDLCMQLLKSLM
ncbi:MAG: hypothetical protein SGJ27_11515 [Candidatus Melainabacteria bacterium]|nr:hypothetical protein [Candidatus Melainabacteria bacterium]